MKELCQPFMFGLLENIESEFSFIFPCEADWY